MDGRSEEEGLDFNLFEFIVVSRPFFSRSLSQLLPFPGFPSRAIISTATLPTEP